MNRLVTLCAAMVLLSALLLACDQGAAGSLSFPLANDACPTSSFGSWRSGHLHAGLDFSTGGVTGVPVLAVDSCWVWRVKTWSGGYGKALYVEFADGKIAVYGHLSRLEPYLEGMLEAKQDLDGAYDVELLFEPRVLSFGPGDTIAYSGETGSGPPHLHFELRSAREDHYKINPVPDHMDLLETSDPVIKSIMITPLEAESSINGGYCPVVVRPSAWTGKLEIGGAFGVSVEAVDPVQCSRIVTPIYYEASIDQVPVWRLGFDRFPFSKAHYVGAFYEILGASKFVRLYDPYDLDLAGFTCLRPDGPTVAGLLVPGEHELAVRVGDAWGNTGEVALPFAYGRQPTFKCFRLVKQDGLVRVEVEPEPRESSIEMAYRIGETWHAVTTFGSRPDLAEIGPGADSRVEVRCRLGDGSGLTREGIMAVGGKRAERDTFEIRVAARRSFVEIYAEATGPPSRLPVAVFRQSGREDSALFQPVSGNLFRATHVPVRGGPPVVVETRFEFGEERIALSTELEVGVLEPGRAVRLSTERYSVRIAAPRSYSSRSLVTVTETHGRAHRGFQSVAGGLAFEPLDVFFNDRVDVVITAHGAGVDSSHGVFAEAGDYVSFRGRFDENGECRFAVRGFEPLVILRDIEGPEIGPVTDFIRRSSDGKATFSSRVTDRGSGVDAGSLRAFVDDDVAIVSIDPDNGLVTGRTIKPLPYGEHRIRLVAEDRLGNRAGRDFTVDLSR